MTVRFNSEGEFLDELRDHPPDIERIVRVTIGYKPTPTLPLEHISVIATYLRDAQIVKLDRYVGQALGNRDDECSVKVLNRAREIADKIAATARASGCESRAGIYEI